MSTVYPNLSADDIQVMTLFFNYVDSDHDGYITVDEIKEACAVDINGDGVITDDEMTTTATGWLAAFQTEDLNGDMKISLDELLQYNNNQS